MGEVSYIWNRKSYAVRYRGGTVEYSGGTSELQLGKYRVGSEILNSLVGVKAISTDVR
jgi:hypothetical protein